MFKEITIAASFASLLAISGCSTMGIGAGSSDEMDPDAECLTEVTRLEGLDMTNDETGEMMFEYWRTEADVIRPFVRAAAINEELPVDWQGRFQQEVENQFTRAFTTACITKGATVRSASLEAGSFTGVWIDMFLDRLEAMVAERSTTDA